MKLLKAFGKAVASLVAIAVGLGVIWLLAVWPALIWQSGWQFGVAIGCWLGFLILCLATYLWYEWDEEHESENEFTGESQD